MEIGVTTASEGLNGQAWNVVGHTYTPKLLSDSVFLWHAEVPDGTFAPKHIHPGQDEWIMMLAGTLDVEVGDQGYKVGPGDTVHMPRGIPHTFINRSGSTATAVFSVAPAQKLYDLFAALDGVTDLQELARLSAAHDVEILPPSSAGG